MSIEPKSLPDPDTHCFDEDTGKDVWSYSAEMMRAFRAEGVAAAIEEAAQAAFIAAMEGGMATDIACAVRKLKKPLET